MACGGKRMSTRCVTALRNDRNEPLEMSLRHTRNCDIKPYTSPHPCCTWQLGGPLSSLPVPRSYRLSTRRFSSPSSWLEAVLFSKRRASRCQVHRLGHYVTLVWVINIRWISMALTIGLGSLEAVTGPLRIDRSQKDMMSG